jgi:hypothetical protein
VFAYVKQRVQEKTEMDTEVEAETDAKAEKEVLVWVARGSHKYTGFHMDAPHMLPLTPLTMPRADGKPVQWDCVTLAPGDALLINTKTIYRFSNDQAAAVAAAAALEWKHVLVGQDSIVPVYQ